jgi:hypothetical protein
VTTDPDLLELAAKAAGKEWMWAGDRFLVLLNANDRYFGPWNPLVDDGEALRLAAQLGLSIIFESGCVDVDGWSTAYYVDHGGDKSAATRRAIVRAAAAMASSASSSDEPPPSA